MLVQQKCRLQNTTGFSSYSVVDIQSKVVFDHLSRRCPMPLATAIFQGVGEPAAARSGGGEDFVTCLKETGILRWHMLYERAKFKTL